MALQKVIFNFLYNSTDGATLLNDTILLEISCSPLYTLWDLVFLLDRHLLFVK